MREELAVETTWREKQGRAWATQGGVFALHTVTIASGLQLPLALSRSRLRRKLEGHVEASENITALMRRAIGIAYRTDDQYVRRLEDITAAIMRAASIAP